MFCGVLVFVWWCVHVHRSCNKGCKQNTTKSCDGSCNKIPRGSCKNIYVCGCAGRSSGGGGCAGRPCHPALFPQGVVLGNLWCQSDSVFALDKHADKQADYINTYTTAGIAANVGYETGTLPMTRRISCA